MIFKRILAFVLLTGVVPAASARTWTDMSGRTMEAEMTGVEGEQVLLRFKGKQIKLPLAKLSLADRAFVSEAKETDTAATPTASGPLTLCGKTLTPGGGVTVVEETLSEATLKSFAKAKAKPKTLKIGIALPAGFDPSKPQRVLWASAPINNDNERKAGNIPALGAYAAAATAAGWVIVASDTDLGNPRGEDDKRSEGVDLAVVRNAVETLTKAWPDFPKWEFACCGYSGGAKASFFRAAELVACDLHVIGMFLSGCNADLTASAKDEVHPRSAGLRKIRVFISNGKSDAISTVAHAESLEKSVKSGPYAKVRLELFDGGHEVNRAQFEEALAWFVATDKKK